MWKRIVLKTWDLLKQKDKNSNIFQVGCILDQQEIELSARVQNYFALWKHICDLWPWQIGELLFLKILKIGLFQSLEQYKTNLFPVSASISSSKD